MTELCFLLEIDINCERNIQCNANCSAAFYRRKICFLEQEIQKLNILHFQTVSHR